MVRVSFSALRGTCNGASFLFKSAIQRDRRPIIVFLGVSLQKALRASLDEAAESENSQYKDNNIFYKNIITKFAKPKPASYICHRTNRNNYVGEGC